MAGRRIVRMMRSDSQESGVGRSATLSSIFSLDPTEEAPVRRVSATSQPRISLLQLNHPAHKEDPPLKYHPLFSFSFIVKIFQALISVICAGMYSEVGKAMTFSTSSQMFPNMVFSSFLIITPVILLSYLLGQKMPELLIRIFNILGGILYMVNFLLHVSIYFRQFQQQWADQLSDQMSHQDGEQQDRSLSDGVDYETDANTISLSSLIGMYMAVTVLSFINSVLYFADVVFSIKRTLSYL